MCNKNKESKEMESAQSMLSITLVYPTRKKSRNGENSAEMNERLRHSITYVLSLSAEDMGLDRRKKNYCSAV